MAKIFISYSVHDVEIVRKIKRDIQACEHTIWMYPEAIDPGEDIIIDEKRGITDSDAVLVMESGSSLVAPAVAKEIKHARQVERKTGRKKLYFACIDPALPVHSDTVQRSDLSNPDYYTSEFHRLMRKIEIHRDFLLDYTSDPWKDNDNWFETLVWVKGTGIDFISNVDFYVHRKIARDRDTSYSRRKRDHDFCLTFYTPSDEYVYAVVSLKDGTVQELRAEIKTGQRTSNR